MEAWGLFISVINQLDAQNFCFTISLFHASTCFEHMCSKHVEAWNKLIVKQKFCASSWLITEMHGQKKRQNLRFIVTFAVLCYVSVSGYLKKATTASFNTKYQCIFYS